MKILTWVVNITNSAKNSVENGASSRLAVQEQAGRCGEIQQNYVTC